MKNYVPTINRIENEFEDELFDKRIVGLFEYEGKRFYSDDPECPVEAVKDGQLKGIFWHYYNAERKVVKERQATFHEMMLAGQREAERRESKINVVSDEDGETTGTVE